MVMVYAFEAWHQVRGENVRSPNKGTEARIERVKGVIVPGTGEDVPAQLIDAEGRYRPV
jgi:hypothetical protein